MKIRLNDTTCIIQFEDKKEEKLIKEFTTYKDMSACFYGGSFHKERAKNVPLWKDVKGYFVVYSGLTKEIMVFAKENNLSITEFVDKRQHFDFQKKQYTYDELRSYFNPNFKYVEHQIRAIQAMLKSNTGIVQAPTSAGKSTIMSAFIRLTKLPTLILVNKVALGIQLKDDFVKAGIDCGVCSGKGVDQNHYCMVSTIGSVHKLDLTRFNCVIVDECHNCSASQFQNFLANFGVPLKYGFSASPSRIGDYLGYAKIRQFLGSPIIKIESKELLDNGVMAKPHLYLVKNEAKELLIKTINDKGEKIEIAEPANYVDYATAYQEEIINNDKRNNKVIKICKKYGSGVLILVNIVDHGKVLENMLPGSRFIYGDTPIDERMDLIRQFDQGELPFLIGSTILQEGISITHMKAMVLACGGKSNVAILQKIGRSLRFKEGEKTEVDYYDFVDTATFLFKHSKMRASLYKKAGYTDIKLLDEDLNLIEKK